MLHLFEKMGFDIDKRREEGIYELVMIPVPALGRLRRRLDRRRLGLHRARLVQLRLRRGHRDVHNLDVRPKGLKAVAHFHEWMSGAGLLFVKKRVPEVATVLTTHSTVVGRALACSGVDIYSEMDRLSPQKEAGAHNCTAQYSMEAACAREADCLTTVSDITALEAKNFLGRSPEVVTPNGLDVASLPDLSESRVPARKAREQILAARRSSCAGRCPPTRRS